MNMTEKFKNCSEKGRKDGGKRRTFLLPAFSPFPTIYSKGFFYRVIKSGDCVVKSEVFTKGQNTGCVKTKSITDNNLTLPHNPNF